MTMGSEDQNLPPHVLIFPLPIQGHVNSMLRLAELLCLAQLDITFIVSEFSHDRLLKHTTVASRFGIYPGFRFQNISDGLPDDHPRAGERVMDILSGTKNVTGPLFKQMMIEKNCFASATRRPVSCMIADGVLSFVGDFAEEKGISLIYFRTVAACSFWACFCIPELIEAGDIPVKGEGMDLLVKSVPGAEGFLRRRDLPGFCRVNDINESKLQVLKSETRQTPRAQAAILNTFEDLEGPILSQVRRYIPKLFTIGPSHSHLAARLEARNTKTTISSGSFWEEDRSCVAWLDSQPPKSVIYVSFGSITVVTREQLLEFWYGLVNSGQKFLWVMRPDSIKGKDGEDRIPAELEEGTKARGYMVGWAPQEEVLNHRAIGGFLTHSGWNSTLESIVTGVPMICWPYFADQMINSRFVSEIWKIGLDMKDTCDRVTIENMVRDLMVVRKDEFLKRADEMARLAKKAVSEGGSSYHHLDGLVEFITSTVS
ncbi:OLC1v1026682C1 [Oldenlandia corymbosa var. corymbosa]|uniref:Glycosyltransferase n=1 Tax=Oldenlandia corymbosa var. corymbosa TaxID=529605 RepID=A0AAV1C825_OLDCO|nr:OLC1v1026682C1 [Oldenlandia corymbosa var. corymbosa]